jgi:hypothetical protein
LGPRASVSSGVRRRKHDTLPISPQVTSLQRKHERPSGLRRWGVLVAESNRERCRAGWSAKAVALLQQAAIGFRVRSPRRSIVKRIVVAAICALVVGGLSHPVGARVVHIQFDTAPDGTAIPSGTAVNTIYTSAYGVTFEAIRCPSCGTDPNVYAASNCRDYLPFSPPNVVSLWSDGNCTPLTERLGVVQATFAAPADSVCLLVMPVRLGEQAIVRAYDAAGVEVATAYSTRSATGTFCIRATGIVRMTFSGAYLGYAWFDDLVVYMTGTTPTRQRTWGALKAIYR